MARQMTQRQGRAPGRTPFPQEEKQFDERTIHIDRVARVVRGGRRFRFRALVIVGDHKGKVGVGIAKGADVTAAITKATEAAKKDITAITIYKNTIPHEAEAKVGGAKILLMPASPGTGLIAGGVVRTILEVVGIHDILSKSLGSSSKINTAYATLEALQSVEPYRNWITTVKKPSQPTAEKAPEPKTTKSTKPKAKK